jgi:hypothetical protein
VTLTAEPAHAYLAEANLVQDEAEEDETISNISRRSSSSRRPGVESGAVSASAPPGPPLAVAKPIRRGRQIAALAAKPHRAARRRARRRSSPSQRRPFPPRPPRRCSTPASGARSARTPCGACATRARRKPRAYDLADPRAHARAAGVGRFPRMMVQRDAGGRRRAAAAPGPDAAPLRARHPVLRDGGRRIVAVVPRRGRRRRLPGGAVRVQLHLPGRRRRRPRPLATMTTMTAAGGACDGSQR